MLRKQPGEEAKVTTAPIKGAGVSSRVEKTLSHGDAAARKLAAVLAHTLKSRGGSLRRLQKGALEAVQKNLEAGKWDGLVKLPTGAGKTRLFCEISGALGLPTLVLVPRKSLVEQTGEAYRKLQEDGAVAADAHISEITSDGGTAAGQVRALLAAWDDAGPGRQEIIVTTYQSLTSLAVTDPAAFADLFVRVEALVSDEAHRSLGRKTRAAVAAGLEQNGHVTWSALPAALRETIREEMGLEEDEALEGEDLCAALRLLADVQNATEALAKMEKEQGRKLHLLFTATPDLIDKSAEGVSPYIYRATLADAAQDGDIVLPSLADVGPAKVTLGEGEEIGRHGVRDGDLDGWIDRFEVEEDDGTMTPVAVAVTKKYLKLRKACGGHLPAVALCRTIEHAGRVVDLLRSEGIRTERVTSAKGDIPEKAAKARLQDGTLEAVVTVTKVSEGWDVPELSAALWYAPTLSPAKNLQANGRIMRAMEGKTRENAFIIEPASWDVTRKYEEPTDPDGDDEGPKGPKKPKKPVDENKTPPAPRVTNLPNSVQRMVQMGELTEEQAAGLYPGVKIEHLPEATEENGWLVDVLWPDGKTEPGRAVTGTMPDVHDAKGYTILRKLQEWRFGTSEQQKWLEENAKNTGAKITGHPVTVVRASALEKFCRKECGGGLPIVMADGTADVLWPDGKSEPGRAVTNVMPDIHGAKGQTIIKRLKAWEKSGTPEQKAWIAANVKDPGAKTDSGKSVTVVRASALEYFCKETLGGSLPIATEKGDWLVTVLWPDGKTEPGRAVKDAMSDVHGVNGSRILRRLKAWKSGTTAQKEWLSANVKEEGAKTDGGKSITVVRISGLQDFIEEKLPCSDPCEANGWKTTLTWPDGTTESGRSLTDRMTDIPRATTSRILRLLDAWQSGTTVQKEWLAANVMYEGARGETGRPIIVVRASAIVGLVKGTLPCSDPSEANGWGTMLTWPDGKVEFGRAVTQSMDIHGAAGQTVRKRLMAWKSGTTAQKGWFAANVKEEGAKTDSGFPVTVVRATALPWFIAQIKKQR